MKNKDLTAALKALRRVVAEPRVDSAYGERLRKGMHELEAIQRSGKLDRRRIFRATALIAETLSNVIAQEKENLEELSNSVARSKQR